MVRLFEACLRVCGYNWPLFRVMFNALSRIVRVQSTKRPLRPRHGLVEKPLVVDDAAVIERCSSTATMSQVKVFLRALLPGREAILRMEGDLQRCYNLCRQKLIEKASEMIKQ